MNLHVLNPARFSCGRTCTPGHLCRFTPIFAQLGSARVVSHTVNVTVQIRDRKALEAAVLKLGGTVQGEGTHDLFSSNKETGFGFRLPNWQYPLILKADNTLAFDDYHGHWGNVKDLDRLKGRYAIEAARQAAEQQGWMCFEEHDGSLVISHPSGGSMTVQPDGTVDAVGFIGSACNIASVIEEAMGTVITRDNKPEFWDEGKISL